MGNKLHMTHKKNKKKKKSKNKSKRLTKYEKRIIDVPLSDTVSKGTKASLGKINYHYQKYYNTFAFIEEIIRKNKKLQKLVCIPDIGDGWMKGIMKIDFLNGDDKSIKPVDSNNSLEEFITKVYKCKHHRLNPINLEIVIPNVGTHANIILIDNKRKTVELFEPHGGRNPMSELESISRAYYKVTKNVERFIKRYLPKYKYIPPSLYEPNESLQTNLDLFSGSCVTWSILYLHYRLLNPNIHQKKLIKYINKRVTRNFLLRYMKYIEDTIKGKL